jgi:hypothetical protein
MIAVDALPAVERNGFSGVGGAPGDERSIF